MVSILAVVAFIILVLTLVSAVDTFLGIKSMRRLSAIDPCREAHPSSVSIVVPACNEEENIERAVVSLLKQEYGNFEIIVINDRSTDGTGRVLDDLKKRHPELQVVHVEHLPHGWMGKANALQLGAEKASGKYLLFTDGDILMEKTTIARACQYMEAEGLDHLAVLFKNSSPGVLLNSLILEAGTGLIQLLRPWRARQKKNSFVGIGAFNMVKRSAYQAIGGHEEIRMHPIDDIMLGKTIKKKGYTQECLIGVDLVTVPWYTSIADMSNGLMKNALAIVNFRFSLLPGILLILFCLNVLPYWGIFLADGSARLIFGTVVVVKLCGFFIGTRFLAISPVCALGTVLTPYITMYIMIRAAWLNWRQQGITWRGTYYPLAALKKNESLFF